MLLVGLSEFGVGFVIFFVLVVLSVVLLFEGVSLVLIMLVLVLVLFVVGVFVFVEKLGLRCGLMWLVLLWLLFRVGLVCLV